MTFPSPLRKFLPMLSLAIALLSARPALALEPDEIVLIVNQNSPESQRLADHYAAARKVPVDQRVALDVPNAEEMSFNDYERNVVPPIRQFLRQRHLETKTKCLLTFYGVPFRIRAREVTDEEKAELKQLQERKEKLLNDADAAATTLEGIAKRLDPSFTPAGGTAANDLGKRTQAALQTAGPKLDHIPDPSQRLATLNEMIQQLQKLGGLAEVDARVGMKQLTANPNLAPAEREKWVNLHQRVVAAGRRAAELQGRRYDAAARAELRQIAEANFGVLGAAHLVESQIDYFQTDKTAAALDNELPLLWVDAYSRVGWQPNPMHYGTTSRVPVVMVMRLDGPDEKRVHAMIDQSIEVERQGIKGIVACDAGHKGDPNQPNNPYAVYDRKIENLAHLVSTKTNLKAKLDDEDRVFRVHSVPDVALYAGWYSLRDYVPGCVFNEGAVGYHTASLEMVALHGEIEPGWVRGLLKDGCVATLGAVAEPYLHSFPAPDEFFPLLMTGRLPLAEVYWKTTPLTSWMISMIGDPLYTPYKTNPAMKVEDLPQPLRQIFDAPGAATRPATAGAPAPAAAAH